ncbi:sensor histidine kinase [Aquibacillus sediminis]|uniref:sensor histidine kinase n=1 Tax=Aquibacillus sediminis TaxID=2574734 RepID=UPI0011085C28|nr:HAMP domain-containing sensor histidine kinase [Aquibacillus sediminis]
MFRNREIKQLITILSLITTIGFVGAVVFFSWPVAFFVLGIAFLLMICALIFTKWRYRELEKLSGYLRQISSGDYTLDVRDNSEGELSILKSDIYKVTLTLAEHGVGLKEEKAKLTNAISDISHQLKTPLTSMRVMADLLRDKKLENEKRSEFTRNIQLQLKRMEWLVSSLLKLSKIDAGTIAFKKETIHVVDLIRRAIEPLAVPIDIKMQQLYIEGDEHAVFLGDFNWSVEALINILKNCVEHTNEGGNIRVTYSENALYTEISIRDTGNGIPKEDLPYIFKRFYKGRNASDDSVGIGLAMAYSIITSQDGDIKVTSEPGKGTLFQIKFFKQVI